MITQIIMLAILGVNALSLISNKLTFIIFNTATPIRAVTAGFIPAKTAFTMRFY